MDEEVFVFGSFRLIPAQRMLLEGGKPLRLGSRAFDILATLVESAGETLRKDQLMARTWPDTVVDEGALRVHVAALRKALGDGQAGKRYIANIPGRGYSFIAPVTHEQRQPAIAPTNGAAVRGNLPAPLTRIVGRDGIIAALAAQLAQHRFLTIVGPGGIGKTTVALAVGEKVSASYDDGVWFVGLAPLPDPDLVASALGTVLGISLPGTNPISGLAGWLRDKHALIVLDSCEHVISAAAAIAEAILKAAVRVSILATSREPLRAEGEWLHRLSSLELPPRSDNLTLDEALQYSSVQLFNERALAIIDGFALDDDGIAPVLEICHRLDGVPLALELAAARVDVFGVKGLAARLDDRFTLLTSGRRTALPRHQTLRATMDWSYELLTTASSPPMSSKGSRTSPQNLWFRPTSAAMSPITACSTRRAPTHWRSWLRAARARVSEGATPNIIVTCSRKPKPKLRRDPQATGRRNTLDKSVTFAPPSIGHFPISAM